MPPPWARRGSAAKVYRAAGLTPILYEPAGRRRDAGISREGPVHLRRALIGLGIGLWQKDPSARTYAASLRERGKPGGIIACALAHRAGKIAFAMVRSQAPYDPSHWSRPDFLPSQRYRRMAGLGLEGRIRRRGRYGGPARVTPSLAWRPAFRPD